MSWGGIAATSAERNDSMKKWLRDNPWIWIVLFFAIMMLGTLVTVMIAEYNRPEILN
jgi:hypothetical protein